MCVCVVRERVNGEKSEEGRSKRGKEKNERRPRANERRETTNRKGTGDARKGARTLDGDTPTTTERFLSKPALSFHANFKFRE